MKTKIKNVIVGAYEYDSIVVDIDGKTTEIAFDKSDEVSKYNEKEIELVCDKGIYKIKPLNIGKKND
jgi:hypothetical protein